MEDQRKKYMKSTNAAKAAERSKKCIYLKETP